MNIGERLCELRQEKGYMQKDVAEILNVAPNTLSGYEKNIRKPDTETIIKMAKFYNVSSDYLLGINEKPTNNEYVKFARELEEKNIKISDLRIALDTILRLKDNK